MASNGGGDNCDSEGVWCYGDYCVVTIGSGLVVITVKLVDVSCWWC